ncbi:DNA topoisomerase 1 [Polyrhizophydium stewartii]|uniref:DNA topoisomerase I n=1 Tax=Polyrhizophydium stewartii TaxID=2732419 RepID=A0ABR4N841_9FUNG
MSSTADSAAALPAKRTRSADADADSPARSKPKTNGAAAAKSKVKVKTEPDEPPAKVAGRKRPAVSESGTDVDDTVSDTDESMPEAEPEASNSQPKRSSISKSQVTDDEDVGSAAKTKKPKKAAEVKSESPEPKGKPRSKRGKSDKSDNESGSQKPASGKTEEEEEAEEFKWWLEQNTDSTVKWTTLRHNGPLFAPPYVPHGVKMLYDGTPVNLTPASEEVASFFAAVVGTDWGNNPTFQKNFFRDFLEMLKQNEQSCPIQEFSKCDFTPITEYLAEQREKKRAMSKEQKQVEKEEKARVDALYGWAMLDGRKEKVGNFRVEPPGLFRGRGEHPRTGALKLRVMPEQVTINIGPDEPIPEPPAGHEWGQVVHDNTVTWLAMWKENVNESFKYVFLAATSSLKGQSDFKKFEKARELKKHAAMIRRQYTEELRDKLMATRQRATALYFIDRLALRAGNEKGDDEADTVGCCSLRYEHITLKPPNIVVFDFLGKDSIRYYNEVEVDAQVFKNIKIFKREPKREGDPLFDRLSTTLLNKHLNKCMEGLTAKVFRTYNASFTFQQELAKTPADGTVAEKLLAYNRANRQVAILCNHQRTVPKTHSNQIARLQDRILALKYERKKIKEQMLEIDAKLRRKRPELAEPESDLDDEFIERHEKQLEEKEAEKARQRLEKENEKRAEEGLSPLKELPPPKRNASAPDLARLEKKLAVVSERISIQKMTMVDKDENKTTALGTSKINYIDPRISAAWCNKHGVPLDKIFNRSLREKFKWAMEVPAEWEF